MEALQGIGGFFKNAFSSPGGGMNWGNVGKAGEVGLLGAGLGGNMAANAQQQKLVSELNNPAQLGQKATQMAGQLNPALVQAVNNQVGGTLAEQGLSQSPGITAATTAGALAPYVQQNYNTSLSEVIQSLMAALSGTAKPTNLAPLMALLSGKQPPPTGQIINMNNQNSNPASAPDPFSMFGAGALGNSESPSGIINPNDTGIF